MSFSISGKTAIVTGAAHGVGLAIGRHFHDEGANVVFADIDEEALEREVGQICGEGRTARLFAGDIRQRLTITNLLSLTIDAFERIDILVNASRQIVPSDPLDLEDTSVEQMLEQNLMTALRLSQATARRMIKLSGGGDDAGPLGSIINLSSIAARRAHPDLLGYSISTAALDQMTRSLAVALAPKRIRVNAVAFGSVMSASLRGALKDHEEFRDQILSHTPLNRIASPGEVSDAVQYLASDASGFVTGQVITVDGGRTLIDPACVAAH
ncbi:MAG: SDR family oxidoreductase [Rhodobacterales bacterium]|nr:SDR family oxidoreductase [Rhodobacterales bacterium]NCT12799.1 SDR family oxidoreductase [Rhodobacterales bacterium]